MPLIGFLNGGSPDLYALDRRRSDKPCSKLVTPENPGLVDTRALNADSNAGLELPEAPTALADTPDLPTLQLVQR